MFGSTTQISQPNSQEMPPEIQNRSNIKVGLIILYLKLNMLLATKSKMCIRENLCYFWVHNPNKSAKLTGDATRNPKQE